MWIIYLLGFVLHGCPKFSLHDPYRFWGWACVVCAINHFEKIAFSFYNIINAYIHSYGQFLKYWNSVFWKCSSFCYAGFKKIASSPKSILVKYRNWAKILFFQYFIILVLRVPLDALKNENNRFHSNMSSFPVLLCHFVILVRKKRIWWLFKSKPDLI